MTLRKCRNCRSKSHFAKDCQHPLICALCDNAYHIAKNCTFRYEKNNPACNVCHSIGHMARFCLYSAETRIKDTT